MNQLVMIQMDVTPTRIIGGCIRVILLVLPFISFYIGAILMIQLFFFLTSKNFFPFWEKRRVKEWWLHNNANSNTCCKEKENLNDIWNQCLINESGVESPLSGGK